MNSPALEGLINPHATMGGELRYLRARGSSFRKSAARGQSGGGGASWRRPHSPPTSFGKEVQMGAHISFLSVEGFIKGGLAED